MNKKKLVTLLGTLTLVAVIGIGATLAYFTDSTEATNVITMGKVDIDLDEPNFDKPEDDPTTPDVDESKPEDDPTTPDIDESQPDNIVTDIVPGEVITKDPTITVKEDSEDAYIRATVTINGDLTDEQKAKLLANINIDDIDPADGVADGNWVKGGDYYYYVGGENNGIVAAGDSVVLFTTVTIPETWGNEVAGSTIEIVVGAEAIQADNFTPSEVNGVYGWYYSDDTVVDAETYEEKIVEETVAE